MLTAVSFLSLSTACNDFGDVNDDKENPNNSNMDFNYVFTQVQAQMAGSDWDIWRNGCIYTLNMIQQTSTVNYSQGLFYTYSGGYNAAFWDNFYSGRGAVRNAVTLLNKWKDDPNHAYAYQYARVMKAYILQRMTDLYGDVPYSEAGLAEISGILRPKYDTQKDIYTDLLKELNEVNTALKTLPVSTEVMDYDVFFKGNSERWRKFANSLMLRVAMRLTKVDPTLAKEYVNKAVSNGLIASGAEDAVYVREGSVVTNDSAEPFGKILSQEDPQAFYVSQYFVDELKANKDPRIHLIATRVKTPDTKWSDGSKYDYGYSNITDSIRGLPIGYSSSAALSNQWSIYEAPGFPFSHERLWPDSIPKTDWRPFYALVNRYTFARPDGPSLFVTYAQDNLLLAEAVVKGFIGGSAESYFKKGIEASMQQYSYYQAATALYNEYLSPDKVQSYIEDRVKSFNENQLKAINWEYYVLTFGDPYETFANWRRSGYPEIKSVYAAPHNRPVYPSSVTNEIPRRFVYPTGETTNNNANYQEAVARLNGGDKMSSRVWWDK